MLSQQAYTFSFILLLHLFLEFIRTTLCLLFQLLSALFYLALELFSSL
jgi:hypothetical protein